MKRNVYLMAMAIATVLFFSACDDDDNTVPAPTIDILEIGIGDSHVGYIGADLHIEADIVAEGLINTVWVEIHAEDGSDYEIEAEYDYSDQILKNTTFHEHVDIPEELEAGEYHFHLIVTDKEGNSTTAEDDITLEELVDEEAPEINVTSAPESGESFASGESLSISGEVTDNIALGGLVVALVYESDNIADDDVLASNTQVIVMAHTHDFEDPDETTFTATIEVGAANDNNMTPAAIEGDNAWKSGSYYILVRSKDAAGNWASSSHYPVEISL